MEFQGIFSVKDKPARASKPLIFDMEVSSDVAALKEFYVKGEVRSIVDDYEEQEKELFQAQNPSLVFSPDFEKQFAAHLETLKAEQPLWRRGKWVYFPWSFTVVHILKDDDFQLVRMSRNRNLITPKEQEKFYNAVVGVAGLSVGNNVALAIVLQGGARHIKIADYDRLALSNMNRIRTGVESLGLSKTEMTARQIYMVNPYAEVEIFSDGLTKKNITDFFTKLDIVVDEIDNLAVKLLIREYAKKHRLPVVMGADNGDNAIVDIERYDEDENTKFFHGRLGDISYDKLANLNKFEVGKTIARHLGVENVTERMLSSFLEMGKTVVSWPQLGGATFLNGTVVAYCVRKIINKQPLQSNRALISLDEKLTPGYNSPQEQEKRAKTTESFKKIFGL